jgi:hypothetical protein
MAPRHEQPVPTVAKQPASEADKRIVAKTPPTAVNPLAKPKTIIAEARTPLTNGGYNAPRRRQAAKSPRTPAEIAHKAFARPVTVAAKPVVTKTLPENEAATNSEKTKVVAVAAETDSSTSSRAALSATQDEGKKDKAAESGAKPSRVKMAASQPLFTPEDDKAIVNSLKQQMRGKGYGGAVSLKLLGVKF